MGQLITSHISDTHNNTSIKTGEGNILFHHGDATSIGNDKQIERFSKFMENQLNNFDHIIFVPGNHDRMFEEDEKKAREMMGSNSRLHVLINQSVTLFDLKIYGSPFSLEYNNWAFMKKGEEIFKEWAKIPNDVEVLITHSPPYGILDHEGGIPLGCNNLMYRIETDFKNLILHGFGHIHGSNGIKERQGKVFLNAACPGNQHMGPFNAWILKWEDKQIIDANKIW